MQLRKWFRRDLEELENILGQVFPVDESHLGEFIIPAKRIFVVEQGRTGLVMKMFAMRLMQIGIPTHIVGETLTPAICPVDLLIAAYRQW